MPVPFKLTFWGLLPPSSSSLKETSAARLPFNSGLNVTLIKQLDPDAT